MAEPLLAPTGAWDRELVMTRVRPQSAGRDYWGVENLRLARNECCQFMTGHTEPIDHDNQQAWWRKVDHSKYRFYTFGTVTQDPGVGMPHHRSHLIGYGVIKYAVGRNWLTGGLMTDWRGQGFGRRLFWSLLSQCDDQWETWLTVREDNMRARKLYEQLGFLNQWIEDAVVGMRWEGF